MELSFHFVKPLRLLISEESTYEKVLNELCTQLSELSAVQAGSGGCLNTMAKIIEVVRKIDWFAIV